MAQLGPQHEASGKSDALRSLEWKVALKRSSLPCATVTSCPSCESRGHHHCWGSWLCKGPRQERLFPDVLGPAANPLEGLTEQERTTRPSEGNCLGDILCSDNLQRIEKDWKRSTTGLCPMGCLAPRQVSRKSILHNLNATDI